MAIIVTVGAGMMLFMKKDWGDEGGRRDGRFFLEAEAYYCKEV